MLLKRTREKGSGTVEKQKILGLVLVATCSFGTARGAPSQGPNEESKFRKLDAFFGGADKTDPLSELESEGASNAKDDTPIPVLMSKNTGPGDGYGVAEQEEMESNQIRNNAGPAGETSLRSSPSTQTVKSMPPPPRPPLMKRPNLDVSLGNDDRRGSSAADSPVGPNKTLFPGESRSTKKPQHVENKAFRKSPPRVQPEKGARVFEGREPNESRGFGDQAGDLKRKQNPAVTGQEKAKKRL
jgi:hypothetical protein